MRNIDSYPVPLQTAFDSSWLQSWRESPLYDRLAVWKDPSEIDHCNIGYLFNLLPNWCISAIESLTRRHLPAALRNRISSHMIVVMGKLG